MSYVHVLSHKHVYTHMNSNTSFRRGAFTSSWRRTTFSCRLGSSTPAGWLSFKCILNEEWDILKSDAHHCLAHRFPSRVSPRALDIVPPAKKNWNLFMFPRYFKLLLVRMFTVCVSEVIPLSGTSRKASYSRLDVLDVCDTHKSTQNSQTSDNSLLLKW